MTQRLRALSIAMFAVLVLAQGCAGTARKDAVPPTLTSQAVVPGLPNVRYRVGIDNTALLREGIASVHREQAHLASLGHHGPLPPALFLAISGGGDDGAFGAGLLNGWTAAGNRPDFKLAYIPRSFNAPHREDFDTEYMQALFKTGFDMAAKGYPWEKAPPLF